MNLQETSSCFKGSSATTLYHHVKMALRSTDNTNSTKEIFLTFLVFFFTFLVFFYLDIQSTGTVCFAEHGTEGNVVLVLSM